MSLGERLARIEVAYEGGAISDHEMRFIYEKLQSAEQKIMRVAQRRSSWTQPEFRLGLALDEEVPNG